MTYCRRWLFCVLGNNIIELIDNNIDSNDDDDNNNDDDNNDRLQNIIGG